MRDPEGSRIAPDGRREILVSAAVAVLAWMGFAFADGGLGTVFLVAAVVATVLALFFLNFFRDPARTPPGDSRQLVSPADGRVLIAEPAVEESRFLRKTAAKISIFMSPIDVHVNRAPIDGEVIGVHYNPGKYLAAFSEKASLDNEQNAVVLRADDGREIAFIQIAGLLARRIVCRIARGDRVVRGQRVGMIKLGSRVDIFIPGEFKLRVAPGDKVTAGETVLGELG